MEKKIQVITVAIIITIVIASLLFFNLESIDPNADPDRDGLTNEQEKLLGSDINHKDLFIEVDYTEGYDLPFIDDALANLTAYYAEKDITVHVDSNSPTNIVPTNLGADDPFVIGMQEEIEEKYHDHNTTHVYLLITKPTVYDGQMGGANPEWGSTVYVYKTHPNVTFLTERSIFHEIGHTIGVGLHDDQGDNEVYCTDVNCSMGQGRLHGYCDDCWESVLAPDDEYPVIQLTHARLWDKWSVDEPIKDQETG